MNYLLLLTCIIGLLLLNIQSPAQSPENFSNLQEFVDTDPIKVLAITDSLISEYQNQPNFLAEIYLNRSEAYYFLDEIEKSRATLSIALKLNKQEISNYFNAYMNQYQGLNYSYLGQPDSALYLHKIALKYFKSLKDTQEISNSYYNIARSFRALSDYDNSILYFDSCYNIDLIKEDSFSLSHTLSLIGQLHNQFYDHQNAREFYEKALNFVNAQDPRQKCLIYTNIGVSFLQEGKYDSTAIYIEKSKDCFDSYNDKLYIYSYFQLLARYEIAMEDTIKALQSIDSALVYTRDAGALDQEIETILMKVNYSPEYASRIDLSEVLKLAEKRLLYGHLSTGYEILSNIMFEKEKYDSAYYYLQKSLEINNDFNKIENKKLLQSQSAKFALKEKENEIKLSNQQLKLKQAEFRLIIGIAILGILGLTGFFYYQRKKARLNQKQKELTKEKEYLRQLSEVEGKAFRAQMNPHFIFNALNSIKGLIVKEQDKKAALYISKFSKLVRAVLDYSKEKTISLEKELELIELYIKLELVRFRDKFQYEINLDPDVEADEIIIPPVIIQPFVENSIWHGFKNNPRKNKLDISVTIQDSVLNIKIEDNGVGRGKTARKKDKLKAKSHGIEISKQRIKNFANDDDYVGIVYEDLKDKKEPVGTKVILKIPLKYKYDE